MSDDIIICDGCGKATPARFYFCLNCNKIHREPKKGLKWQDRKAPPEQEKEST